MTLPSPTSRPCREISSPRARVHASRCVTPGGQAHGVQGNFPPRRQRSRDAAEEADRPNLGSAGLEEGPGEPRPGRCPRSGAGRRAARGTCGARQEHDPASNGAARQARPGPRFPRTVSGGSDQPTPGRGPVGPEHPRLRGLPAGTSRASRARARIAWERPRAAHSPLRKFPLAAEGSALGGGPEAVCRGTVRRGGGLSTCRATAQRRPRIGRVGRPSRPRQQRQI